MHEFNSETATWFTVYTLVDISSSPRRKDVSQKNWDMIINCISMFCQPLGSLTPDCKKKKLVNFKFGSEYNSKLRNVWTWSFAVEHQGLISIKQLINELNGIPVSDKLQYIETKNAKIKNTYFLIGMP
jgi:hypothetical protein|tara:strand:+ start:9076 stop:9459 length:384 start_codon:yes stop_codon:yes gene_type:complete